MPDKLITMSDTPIAGISIGDSGAIIAPDTDESSILSVMENVAKAGQICNFILGDLMNFAKDKWGEDIQGWCAATGLDKQTLWDVCSTSRRVATGERMVGVLSWNHHKAVAKLDAPAQAHWLAIARDKGLPYKRFRKSIEIGRIATKAEMAPEPETNRGYENIMPHVNRLTAFLLKKEHDGNFDRMEPKDLLTILEDLQPVLTQTWGVVTRIEDSEESDVIREAERVLADAGFHISLSYASGEGIDVIAEIVEE